MPDTANEPTIWLSDIPATDLQRRRCLTLMAIMLAVFVAVVPFATVRLPGNSGSIPICSGDFYCRSDHRGFDIHYALRRSLSRAVGPRKRLSFQRDFSHSTYFDFSECLCARGPSRSCASNHRMAICHLAFRFPCICDRLCRSERQNRFGKKAAKFRSLRHYLQRRNSYCFGLLNHLGLAGSRRPVAALSFSTAGPLLRLCLMSLFSTHLYAE